MRHLRSLRKAMRMLSRCAKYTLQINYPHFIASVAVSMKTCAYVALWCKLASNLVPTFAGWT